MAQQDSARLRRLVREYFDGSITRDTYRELRAELLDNLGLQPGEHAQTASPRDEPVDEGKRRISGLPADPSVSQSPSRPGKTLIIATATVVLLAIAYAAVTQLSERRNLPQPTATQDTPPPGSDEAPGEELISAFLLRNEWDEQSLSEFLLAWEALDDIQRQQATERTSYRRFATKLHQRIREEAALGDAPVNDRLDSLTALAVEMGVPYRASLIPRVEEPTRAQAVEGDTKPVPEVPVPEDLVDAPKADLPEDIDKQPDDVLAETAAKEEVEQVVDDMTPGSDQTQSDAVNSTTALEDPCRPEIANTRRPYCNDVLPDGTSGPPLVVLPTGIFDMGDDGNESESPRHRVEIANNIAMSRFEITAAEYASYCAAVSITCEDSAWSEEHPVVLVSWDDAVSYTEWLSEATGYTYRLPSEAEWEYAARGGTDTPYFFGDEITPSAAHSSENGETDSPLPRTNRGINRNPFRLYHMSGNVREWTYDPWYPNHENAPDDGSPRELESGDARVVRGGSHSDSGDKLRSSAREPLERSHRDEMTGFRVVREVDPQAIDN